jgi:hypothetical protein
MALLESQSCQISTFETKQERIINYLEHRGDLSVDELSKLIHLTLILEKTNIVSKERYRYELVRNRKHCIYKSRYTI